jgi:hypothetical protein
MKLLKVAMLTIAPALFIASTTNAQDSGALEKKALHDITEAVSELEDAESGASDISSEADKKKFIKAVKDALSKYYYDQALSDDPVEGVSTGRSAARDKASSLRQEITSVIHKRAQTDVEKGDRAWKSALSAGDDTATADSEYERAAKYYALAIDRSKNSVRRVGAVPKYR